MSELKNEFSWSKSRDATFQECRRAYFLAHYGSWGGWERNVPEELRQIYWMKNLSSRPAWMGIVVHEVAERAIRMLQDGQHWSLDAALEEAEKRMRVELEASRTGAYMRGAKVWWNGRRVRINGFQEHYYHQAVTDAQWEETIAQALTCIRVLYASPTFRRLTQLEPDAFLSVEDLQQFRVGDVKVWVKLDLAVRAKDGGAVIVDWKTGLSHQASDIALQLGIYGLYASHLWQLEPEQIQGFDVNLRDGATRKHTIDRSILANVAEYIQNSADAMRGLLSDVEENRAEISQFPMTSDLTVCARCRFRRACDREGLESVSQELSGITHGQESTVLLTEGEE